MNNLGSNINQLNQELQTLEQQLLLLQTAKAEALETLSQSPDIVLAELLHETFCNIDHDNLCKFHDQSRDEVGEYGRKEQWLYRAQDIIRTTMDLGIKDANLIVKLYQNMLNHEHTQRFKSVQRLQENLVTTLEYMPN